MRGNTKVYLHCLVCGKRFHAYRRRKYTCTTKCSNEFIRISAKLKTRFPYEKEEYLYKGLKK